MGLIAALIATSLCAVMYVRMVRRELPEPLGKKKAMIPLGFGLLAIFLTLPMVILFGLLVQATVGSISDAVSSLVLRSLLGSFLLAGFTEEFIKFLMLLPVLRIVKPRNVYEYGLLGAGVGLGFTALEELLYAGKSPMGAVFRILFFAMHLLFGLLMGTHLGLAKYSRREGRGDAGKHTFLAFFLPILWHTVFDASTTANAALNATEEATQVAGVVIALVVCAVSIALQFVLLIRFRKKTAEYCSMRLDGSAGEDGEAAASPVSEEEIESE